MNDATTNPGTKAARETQAAAKAEWEARKATEIATLKAQLAARFEAFCA